jgi:RNA polymerase sigma factor (TIGR02999 family)
MSGKTPDAIPPGEPGRRHRSADLIATVYEDLRRLAAQKMARESPGHTLSATALVHEAYLRVASDETGVRWENRSHFYFAAAEAMRRILIDRARRKNALRHGAGAEHDPLDSITAPAAPQRADDLLALDDALQKFAVQDERKAKLVELRFFAGLTSGEAAEVLGISKPTADRDWIFARAWLLRELEGGRG